jgi:hypothetical protein
MPREPFKLEDQWRVVFLNSNARQTKKTTDRLRIERSTTMSSTGEKDNIAINGNDERKPPEHTVEDAADLIGRSLKEINDTIPTSTKDL